MNKKRINIVALTMLLCVIISIVIILFPRSMMTILHLKDDIKYCDILRHDIAGKKEMFELEGDKLLEITDLLKKKQVQWIGRYGGFFEVPGNRLYHIYFSSKTKNYEGFMLDERGNVYFHGNRYKVLKDNPDAIYKFLNMQN